MPLPWTDLNQSQIGTVARRRFSGSMVPAINAASAELPSLYAARRAADERSESARLAREKFNFTTEMSNAQLGLSRDALALQREQNELENELTKKSQEIERNRLEVEQRSQDINAAEAEKANTLSMVNTGLSGVNTTIRGYELYNKYFGADKAAPAPSTIGTGTEGAMAYGASQAGSTYGGLTATEMAGASGYAPAGLTASYAGAMPAGATAAGATYGGLTGAEMAGASGYAAAGAGEAAAAGTAGTGAATGLSAWTGPAAAIAIPLMAMWSGSSRMRRKKHAMEDWMNNLKQSDPEMYARLMAYGILQGDWNAALNASVPAVTTSNFSGVETSPFSGGNQENLPIMNQEFDLSRLANSGPPSWFQSGMKFLGGQGSQEYQNMFYDTVPGVSAEYNYTRRKQDAPGILARELLNQSNWRTA